MGEAWRADSEGIRYPEPSGQRPSPVPAAPAGGLRHELTKRQEPIFKALIIVLLVANLVVEFV